MNETFNPITWLTRSRWCLFGAVFLVASLWVPTVAWSMGEYSRMIIPQIRYKGGNYKPRPHAIESLLGQTAKRTSVEVKREARDMDLSDPDLFLYPFIYLAGDSAFPPFPDADLKILRNYLNYGGLLLIDDNSAKANSEFDDSVRKLVGNLFPNIPMQRISKEHSLFRSFYLIHQIGGRANIKPYLDGITIKGRTVLIYSSNDLGGAWSRSKLGHWNYDILAGGRFQRKMAVRLGINIVMYALTLDYKKDMVHLPIILERLRRSNLR